VQSDNGNTTGASVWLSNITSLNNQALGELQCAKLSPGHTTQATDTLGFKCAPVPAFPWAGQFAWHPTGRVCEQVMGVACPWI
jgi:hypothetical protein